MNNKKDIYTNKKNIPLVSILLAVYKPNEKWLIEQLDSLNNQDYKNLNLYIYDDCPQYPAKREIFQQHITNFEYKFICGKENRGSNFAFQELTKIADGEFFSYCDQDDIWESNKISSIMKRFDRDKNVTLVCSDLSIINENSEIKASSITDIRKRIVYKSGNNLAKDLLITNFVTGCTMIVKSEVARKSIPFAKELIHDQWIAIIAALNGKIDFIDDQLVRYRQHSNNQTGILTGIIDKKTYYMNRIDSFINRYNEFAKRLGEYTEITEDLKCGMEWLEARKKYSKRISIKNLKIMIKYRKYQKVSVILESVMPFIPDFIFKYIIKLAKKNVL